MAITVEERLAAVEQEVAELKQRLAASPVQMKVPWWEKIAGTFAGSEEYEEAMKLGRAYRESLRPESADEPPQPW